MVARHVSIDYVISRVIRNTRVVDMSLVADMHDWIAEALASMKCTYMLAFKYADLDAIFYGIQVPCDASHIEGVEYCGRRLPYNAQSIHPGAAKRLAINAQSQTPKALVSIPTTEEVNGHTFYSSSLVELNSLDLHPCHYYQLEPGTILTSFETGCARVHYKGLKTDKKGLPLIPDVEALKEALYYYCRSKMQGAGWVDPTFKEELLNFRYELNAGRAIELIMQESPDMAQSEVNTLTRFVPPAGYYESFFSSPSPETPLLL